VLSDFIFSIGRQYQEAMVLQVLDQVDEGLEGCFIGPLEVFQDEKVRSNSGQAQQGAGQSFQKALRFPTRFESRHRAYVRQPLGQGRDEGSDFPKPHRFDEGG